MLIHVFMVMGHSWYWGPYWGWYLTSRKIVFKWLANTDFGFPKKIELLRPSLKWDVIISLDFFFLCRLVVISIQLHFLLGYPSDVESSSSIFLAVGSSELENRISFTSVSVRFPRTRSQMVVGDGKILIVGPDFVFALEEGCCLKLLWLGSCGCDIRHLEANPDKTKEKKIEIKPKIW